MNSDLKSRHHCAAGYIQLIEGQAKSYSMGKKYGEKEEENGVSQASRFLNSCSITDDDAISARILIS